MSKYRFGPRRFPFTLMYACSSLTAGIANTAKYSVRIRLNGCSTGMLARWHESSIPTETYRQSKIKLEDVKEEKCVASNDASACNSQCTPHKARKGRKPLPAEVGPHKWHKSVGNKTYAAFESVRACQRIEAVLNMYRLMHGFIPTPMLDAIPPLIVRPGENLHVAKHAEAVSNVHTKEIGAELVEENRVPPTLLAV